MKTEDTALEYVHLPQSEDLGPKGRSYTITEKLVEFGDRKILVLETEASDISFCDSSHACELRTLIAKGYVKRWKYRKTAEGMDVSLLEPIPAGDEKIELHKYLRKTYNVENIV